MTNATSEPRLAKDATPALPQPASSWLGLVTAEATALILGLGVLALLWFLRRPLAVFFFGLTLASALLPVASWLKRWLPWNVATLLVYGLLALLLAGLAALILPTLVNQAEQLVRQAPEYVAQAESWIETCLGLRDDLPYEQFLSQITGIASTLATLPIQISSSLIDTFLVVFISLYTLLLAPEMHDAMLSLFPKKHHDRVQTVVQQVVHAMGGYFRGSTLTGAVIGSVAYVGLLIIGIDFALVSALIAGLSEFIPFLGPLIAAVIIVIISFLQSPQKALFALVFMIILQQLESNLIAPNIMHPQTCISPLATLVALFAGGSVGGVLGALVAIPLYAGLRVLIIEGVFPLIRRQTGADPVDSGDAC
jgi:predicted PurR-regulated permease PerM